jgi:serine/threonine protein kinase
MAAKYATGKLIGAGGNGQVYKGRNKQTNQRVAIKRVAFNNIAKWVLDSKEGKIPLEVDTLRRLKNVKGVIPLLDYYIVKDKYHLVFPLVGCDMFSKLDAGKFSDETARRYLAELVRILRELHENDVAHLDIKDENVLIDDDDNLTLIDFGAARRVQNQPYFNDEFMGTKEYSPPEALTEKTCYAVPTTVWSLGILMYDMLTTTLPFHGDEEIIKGQLAFPDYVSESSRSLIRQCLMPNQWERLSLDELAAMLE